MSVAWDITTLTINAGDSYDVSGDLDALWIHGFAATDDGLNFIISDHSERDGTVVEYNMSPAWDVSTATLSGAELDISAIIQNGPTGAPQYSPNGDVYATCFSDDGTYFFIGVWYSSAGDQPELVFTYQLSTAWDITTGSLLDTFTILTDTLGDRLKGLDIDTFDGTIVSIHSGNSANFEMSAHDFTTPASEEEVGEALLYKTEAGFGASTQGKLLKFCQTDEVAGGDISKHFDTFMQFTSPGTTITMSANGGYIEGMTVGVWVDGVDDGDYTLDSSLQITGVTSGTDVIVGFRYVADYISNKLTGYSSGGSLNAKKRVINTGLIMRNYVPGSLKIGPSLTQLGNMPALEAGTTPISGKYDYFPFPFDGISETDPRIAFRATGPCKIMALSYDVKDTSARVKATTSKVE